MSKPDHPLKVGDQLRDMLRAAQEKMNDDTEVIKGTSDANLADALAEHIHKFLKASNK